MNGKNSLVLDVEEVPSKVGHWIIFAIQHILAILVAYLTNVFSFFLEKHFLGFKYKILTITCF